MSQIPDIPPKIFTLSATAIGYLLLDDLTSTQQNAVGNWFMLIGQILCTNGSYQFHKEQGPTVKSNADAINTLTSTIDKIRRELEELKKYNQE